MAKQLIVSVNGREKKIAIIEDDKVSEFYIERGEQHQGIVGNIYKGRVMRVLPGMQSAFVDIGLERDELPILCHGRSVGTSAARRGCRSQQK